MPRPATGKNIKTVTIDTVMVRSFSVNIFPVKSPMVVIDYMLGKVVDDVFVPSENKQKLIRGRDFEILAGSTPAMNNGIMGALEALLYEEIEKDAL